MKKCLKTGALSGGHTYRTIGHSLLLALFWAILPFEMKAADLVINGITLTVPGATYDIVYITNDGKLTVTGPLIAKKIVIAGGSLVCGGTIDADEISLISGTMQATSDFNRATSFTIDGGAKANLCGIWNSDNFIIRSNGILAVFPFDGTTPSAGIVTLQGGTIHVELGGKIDADFAGNDPRGRASSFANAGGGGHGGNGAHGWWNASTQGFAFGDAYTFVCDMGSAGGQMGGGGVALIGTHVIIDGVVSANGRDGVYLAFQHAPGGGSGGTILTKAGIFSLTGTLSANGGNGDTAAGPGAGGRIKIFYENGDGTNLLSHCSVAPGPNHTDKGPAEAGTIWLDAVPGIPTLVSPTAGETVAGGGVTFRFTVTDGSVTTDGRSDDLLCAIELSTNGFATISYTFDQTNSLTGWSKFSYKNGDEAVYTSASIIAEGSYRWRAIARDRSILSTYSQERVIHVGAPTYLAGTTLQIEQAVQIRFMSQNRTYRLQTSSDLMVWSNTNTLIQGTGAEIKFYLPVDAEVRYFRLLEL